MSKKRSGRKRRDRRTIDYLLRRCPNCILCGEPFHVRESITREHLIPRSIMENVPHNVMLSHYNCNQFRGTLPSFEAILLIQKKRKKLGENNFLFWINKKIPKGKKKKVDIPSVL